MRTDIKKDRKDLYLPGRADFTEVDVPAMTYLAIDGHGDPNTSPAYATAIQALYAGAYAIRAVLKKRTGDDFVVGPLEGLWTSADNAAFVAGDKGEWDWTMMIPLPEAVSSQDIAEGLAQAARKKPELPVSALKELSLNEGRSLQILHVGTYDDETPTLARLHDEIMPGLGLTWNGPHHEIYLSDPRRVAPERMKTVLRQPVRSVVEANEAGQKVDDRASLPVALSQIHQGCQPPVVIAVGVLQDLRGQPHLPARGIQGLAQALTDPGGRQGRLIGGLVERRQ